MNTFAKITATETKLFLRSPFMAAGGLVGLGHARDGADGEQQDRR
ncbi:hypothetical protein [Amycolatopsis kentuckyensis]|nr:hypothetical protein [Amycolatopsis kentuckyensis]